MQRHVSKEELYDLFYDPNEANNLADRPGHEKILGDLRGRLDRWMKRTDDPALRPGFKADPRLPVADPDGRKK